MSADNHPPIVETPPVRALAAQLWHDEEDTARLAQALARQALLRDAFITLHGDLGAGKTTFVRHLLRAMGVSGRIKSPTYAVVEPHQGAAGQAIYHFDFYRFSDPREWEDAGFRDIFAGPGLKLAEWPGNARGQLPVPDMSLTLDTLNDDTRHVTLQAHTERGEALLRGLE